MEIVPQMHLKTCGTADGSYVTSEGQLVRSRIRTLHGVVLALCIVHSSGGFVHVASLAIISC